MNLGVSNLFSKITNFDVELTVSGGEVLSNIIELSKYSYQVHLYGSGLSVNYHGTGQDNVIIKM